MYLNSGLNLKNFMKLNLLSVISTEYDLDFIPHFEDYYSKYDIDEWHIILHGKNKQQIKKGYEKFNKEINFYTWEDTFLSSVKIGKFNEIISSLEGYVLLADADEFHEFKESPKNLIKQYNFIGTILKDRFANNFSLNSIEPDINLFLQFPLKNDFSNEQIGAWNFKPVLFSSDFKLINSHQVEKNGFIKDYKNVHMIETAHFKWTSNRKNKTIERYNLYLKANREGHAVNFEESAKILKLIYNIEV